MSGCREGVGRRAVVGAILLATVAAASGAHAGECPDWTQHKPSPAYPTDRFVVGLGIVAGVYDAARGEGRGRASAQADIAGQLMSRVETEIVIDASGTNQTSTLSVREKDRITTSLVGPGARAVDRCWDWKATTFYLLAVLDRREAAGRVRTDLDAANKRGEAEVAAAEAVLDGDPLAAIAPMGRAFAAERDVLMQSAVLRALAATAAPPAFATHGKLDELARRIRTRTRIQVAVDDPDLRSQISDRLTSAHLESTTVPSQALVRVTATVETLRLERSAALGLFVAKVRASVQLVRLDSGAILGTTAREGTNGGPSEDVARRRAVADAAKTLLPAVDQLLSALTIAPARAAEDGGAARAL